MFEQFSKSRGVFSGFVRLVVILAALAVAGIAIWLGYAHHKKTVATKHHPVMEPSLKAAPPSAANPSAANPLQFQPGWYKLQPGDMLSELALRAYGRADWSPIVRANPRLPQDLRKMQAGWTIYIPSFNGPYTCPCGQQTAQAPTAAPRQKADAKAATNAFAKANAGPAAAITAPVRPDASRILNALRHSAAASTVTLAVVEPQRLTQQIDDPPLTAMEGLAISLPLVAAPAAPIALAKDTAPQHVRETHNVKTRAPKGYAVVLPSGMTAALINRQLETREYFFGNGERIAESQHRIGDSEVKVQHGRFVLYVPLTSIPSGTFNLAVAGLSGPVTGAFFRSNATPVYRHFPVSSHRIAHFLLGTGQSAGSGAIAYFALGPVAGAGAFAATTVIRIVRHHHEKSVIAREEAAKNAAFNANLDLERAEQQQAALTSSFRGQAP